MKETGLFNLESGERRLVFRNFVSQFFGLLGMVLAGLFSQDLDLAVKIMEPFYHLSKAEGANGQRTLLVNYFRPLVYSTHFQAAHYSHWAVVLSSLANIISTNVLLTLALGVFGGNSRWTPNVSYVYPLAEGVLRRHNTAYPTTMDHFRQEGIGAAYLPEKVGRLYWIGFRTGSW